MKWPFYVVLAFILPTLAAHAQEKSEWIEGKGDTIVRESTTLLVDWNKKAIVELNNDDIRIEGDNVRVRLGSVPINIHFEEPACVAVSAIPEITQQLQAVLAGGAHGRVFCISPLQYCCKGGKIVNICTGVWPCGVGVTNHKCPS